MTFTTTCRCCFKAAAMSAKEQDGDVKVDSLFLDMNWKLKNGFNQK